MQILPTPGVFGVFGTFVGGEIFRISRSCLASEN